MFCKGLFSNILYLNYLTVALLDHRISDRSKVKDTQTPKSSPVTYLYCLWQNFRVGKLLRFHDFAFNCEYFPVNLLNDLFYRFHVRCDVSSSGTTKVLPLTVVCTLFRQQGGTTYC